VRLNRGAPEGVGRVYTRATPATIGPSVPTRPIDAPFGPSRLSSDRSTSRPATKEEE